MIPPNEKSDYESHSRRLNPWAWKNASLSLLTLLLLVPIYQYLNTNSSTNELVATTSPYSSIETIELTSSEKDDLKRLGLTPKKPIKIVTDEKGNQIVHGRFLHITDIHPDPYFKEGSSFDELCHRSKGNAHKYGDAISGCDAPMALMEETIKWVETNLKNKIDFIVWTGDNVRHDNDRNYPRTEQNIFEMNEHVSKLMFETFKKKDTPELEVDLIPSLGNNDVYPHNLFSIGPTLQTRELFQIWQRFIPQSQLHTFNRGAYFFKEVIPGQLAILSINTLYLFQSNPLVDNCDKRKQPGYKLFEWLGYVLKELRARKMKVWLTGHVPPNEKNYDLTCLRKYIVWIYEFRDIIVGGLYGHMNLDHFIPLDSVAAYKSIKDSQKKQKSKQLEMFEVFNQEYNDDLGTDALGETTFYQALDAKFDDSFFRIQGGVPANKVAYMETVREEVYAKIKGKKKQGDHGERYSISHVGSSVVPTFNPGLRVWEYNITNLANEMTNVKFEPWGRFFSEVEALIEKQDTYTDDFEESSVWSFIKRDKTFPLPKPKGAKLGPAYIPQTYTPERYVQYYADLASINKGKKEFDYEIEYSTDDSLYNLPVLTVEEWLKYARKLGKPAKANSINAEGKNKHKKKKHGKAEKGKNGKKLQEMWAEYLKNTFVSSNYENSGLG
ncbi:PPN1 [Candida margitis]|uniref:PPN1 n=1 Tax=Candida margitis TaxID=1775924 RepID=UPI002227953D|nr:PPN1 [Candida margitis]KAI5958159.1 PPN1 [Candida margitis]